MKNIRLRNFLFLLAFLACWSASSQDLTGHNWYFGNSPQGIVFNRVDNTPTVVITQATPFGTGGSAVATDATNGNLLFYTDGANVFDVNHAVMPNGIGLNANTSGNQPVAICPVPGQPMQYYIFTNTAGFTTGGTLSRTTVDMSQFGNAVFPTPPLGDVTGARNVALGLNNRSEGMVVVPHDNGMDYWLITQQNGSDNYTVTLVTTGGTFTHTTFSGLTGLPMVAANLSYNDSTGRVAVSPQTPNRDAVVLNFNNSTGALSFNRFLFNSAIPSSTTNEAIFDMAWSLSGQYLYLSVHGDAGIQADVVQFDFGSPAGTLNSVLPQPNNIFRSYGLQRGPDSLLYHLYQAVSGGPFLLGSLGNTDTIASEVVYSPDAFGGALNFTGTQFPAFSPKPDPNLSVSFLSHGTCSNTATSFFPTVIPTADRLEWDFGDGQGSVDWSPVHTYAMGGSYPVTVTAFLNGDTATFTAPVNITQFDLQITLVQDTAACRDEFPPPRGNSNPMQFSVTAQVQGGSPVSSNWSNGDSGLTLMPDSAGYYYLVVDDASGCSAYAGVNVREYGLQDQRANVWYFGNHAGVDFNEMPPVAISNPSMDAPEGCSIICDRNGRAILYTDGESVWDRNDALVATGIGGDPNSTQSVLIVPVPNDETLYYIFTTQAVDDIASLYQLRYSLFDLKLNSGTGGLAEQNVLLFSRSTERITGNGQWVIAHEFGNNSFRAYAVTPNGISAPIISAVGSSHGLTPVQAGQGYMKLGPQNRLAVAVPAPGVSNTIEIFDFDPTAGKVSNERTANLNNTTGNIYGIEFSPGGNKLFATLSGGSSQLYEFAFDSLGAPYFQQAIPQAGQLGALQIGPTGQIYMAAEANNSLLSFTANEDTTMLSSLGSPQSLGLISGTNSRLGLPNFIQNVGSIQQTPSIAAQGLCLGDTTYFAGAGKDPSIDMFQWFFGDGFGASGQSAAHLYASAGTYNVTLHITNRCGLDTMLTQKVTISNKPANPTFLPPGQQAVLCTGSVTLEATPASNPNLANLSFLWSTGEVTRTIVVNQQSQVSVTISNVAGCTSTGSIIVADNRPIFDLGADQTLCQNTALPPLDAQNPGTNYVWTINGSPAGNGQTQAVNTANPGAFTYQAQVTDPITGCMVTDQVTFTFIESPVFTVTTTNTTMCATNTGQIDVNITGPASGLFSYFVTGPGTSLSDIDQTTGPLPSFTNLGAGTYGITLSDQISGCASITTAGVSDNSFTVSGAPLPPLCDPIAIQITTVPAVGALTYQVTNATLGTVVDSGNVPGGSPFNSNPLASGNYIVEVTETASNCIGVSPTVNVQQNPTVPVTFDMTDICNGNIMAVAAGASFDWSASPAGSINGATANATANINPGSWTLVVTATDGTNCPATRTVNVLVDNFSTTDFTQSDACEDQVTLKAAVTPPGSYTYRWYRNGALILGGSQIMAGLSDNGASYRVEAVSNLTGCIFSSTAKVVNVAGDLQVSLSTTPPCDGLPFTLTATSNLGGVSYQWSYEEAPISGETSSTLQDTRAGDYGVEVSLPGCVVDQGQTIELAPATAGALHNTYTICPSEANPDPDSRIVELDAGDNFTSYEWFKEEISLGITTQTYVAIEKGNYSVDLVNIFNCPSSDKTEVIEECEPRIKAPNAFRPGSSVINSEDPNLSNGEFWVLTPFVADEDFRIFIFNRWGEMVFQSDQRAFRWNGGFNNNSSQPLPPGNYSYVIKFKSLYRPDLGLQETRGGVVLLR